MFASTEPKLIKQNSLFNVLTSVPSSKQIAVNSSFTRFYVNRA